MKIGVFSDTHGDLSPLFSLKERLAPLDAVFHCGDFAEEARDIGAFFHCPYYAVKGNCDYYCHEPLEKLVTLGGKTFLLLHGHTCTGEMSLVYKGQMAHADAVLFGHSHIPYESWHEGILLLNPGSLSRPRALSKAGCVVLTIAQGEIRVERIEV